MPHSTSTLRTCKMCKEEKSLSDFSPTRYRCKPCRAELSRNRYAKDPIKVRQTNDRWRTNNLDYVRKHHADYMRNKAKTDPEFALTKRMRHRMWKALKGQGSWSSSQEKLGYSITELKEHLESKFQEGMSWGNMGQWHIDHIIPIASFDDLLNNEDELMKAWSLSNLQPLWAKDNLIKRSKVCPTVPLP